VTDPLLPRAAGAAAFHSHDALSNLDSQTAVSTPAFRFNAMIAEPMAPPMTMEKSTHATIAMAGVTR
jgi:hypothetical protein